MTGSRISCQPEERGTYCTMSHKLEEEEEEPIHGITGRWIILALILAFLSLGPSGLLQLSFGLGSFLAGAGLLWYGVTTTPFNKLRCFRRRSGANAWHCGSVDTPTSKLRARDVRGIKVGNGLFGSDMPDTSARHSGRINATAALAGSSPIDDPLNQILAFVFRDFVYSWHFRLTHSHSFPQQAEDSIHNFIRRLSEGIQRVDWIPFLTTSLVDDVASHVKLFKKARIKSRQKQESVASDLDGLFFDAGVAVEDNKICRDLVSTIQQEEHNYLQNVSEILLFLLMPDVRNALFFGTFC